MTNVIAALDTHERLWFEARISDYQRDDRIEAYRLGRAIVIRARDNGLRLRLIVDEATDIRSPGLDPLLPLSYGILSDEVFLCAEEVIIRLRDGRRLRLFGRNQTDMEFIGLNN